MDPNGVEELEREFNTEEVYARRVYEKLQIVEPSSELLERLSEEETPHF